MEPLLLKLKINFLIISTLLVAISGAILEETSDKELVFLSSHSYNSSADISTRDNNEKGNRATLLSGVPIPSLTASLAVSNRGPILFQEFFLMDKLGSFVRERIPERAVHAKGAGAHGYFIVTHDISKYTKAKFLNGIGKRTPTFVRFSTVEGESGTPDTVVDARGFATKFYTEDGNHDLLALTLNSFPISDPLLFPDMNKSRKKNPVTNTADLDTFWDFVSLRPESTLNTLQLHADQGRPDGYRRANGFGVNTYKLVNADGVVVYAKFHWRTEQPAPALTHQEYADLAGSSPEYKTLDLYNAIQDGNYPSWNFYIQVMTPEEIKVYPRNPFDATKNWREEDFPLIPIGRMTLNRNPENYFAAVEQVGFQVNNMVPGIEPSPDRLLTGRLFVYQDAQRYRLGVNGAQIPINRPISPVNSYDRNGFHCDGDNGGGTPNYYPNSFGGVGADKEGAGQTRFYTEGVVDRVDMKEGEDEYIEARLFLQRDVDRAQRKRLIDALVERLKTVKPEIRERVLRKNIYPVETKFGDELTAALDKVLKEGNKKPLMGW